MATLSSDFDDPFEGSIMTFADLPPELIHHIVSFLNAKEMCVFACVYKIATMVCTYDKLWRDKVDPTYNPFSGSYRERCVTYYQLLRLVEIFFTKDAKTPSQLMKMICIDPRNTHPGKRNFFQIERAYFSCTNVGLLSGSNLCELTSLRELHISYNRLSSLPGSVCEIPNLERLELDGNLLSEVPKELAKLTSLRTLNLDSNRLENFPLPILRLSNLEELGIRHNNITSLPSNLGSMFSLSRIRLDLDKILDVSDEIRARLMRDDG